MAGKGPNYINEGFKLGKSSVNFSDVPFSCLIVGGSILNSSQENNSSRGLREDLQMLGNGIIMDYIYIYILGSEGSKRILPCTQVVLS